MQEEPSKPAVGPSKQLFMRHTSDCSKAGFTLVELLVVIAIIGILAAILLPALKGVTVARQRATAKMDMAKIISAIHEYQAANNVFPIGRTTQTAALSNDGDFTFGGTFATPTGVPVDVKSYAGVALNSEMMGVLLNLEYFPNSTPTINQGHIKNPQNHSFLSVNYAPDSKSPGLGLDGVYRDPWGNPYVITIDANADEKARDAFYSDPRVSADPSNANAGLQGLVRRMLPSGAAVFECPASVTVWSAGPDRMIDPNLGNSPTARANKGANKDNLVSWQ